MKVQIGPYKSWFGPYQLAEKLCWWVPKVSDEYGIMDKPRWVHRFGEWLAHGSIEPDPKPGDNTSRPCPTTRPETWLYRLLTWIDSKRSPVVYVRIDPWDTWTADTTLSHIILPLLKQIKLKKQGAPHVDDEDVPEYLRNTGGKSEDGSVDDNYHKRWEYVLDQMIFAFENVNDGNWEEQFVSGTSDYQSKVIEWKEDGTPKLYQLVEGPNHTYKIDTEGRQAYQDKISTGLKLFGKYYQCLWN